MLPTALLLIFGLTLAADASTPSQVEKLPYKLPLGGGCQLSWNFNWRANFIVFNVEVPQGTTVVGLGFSDRGKVEGADFGIVYIDASELLTIADFRVTEDKTLKRQPKSEYELKAWDTDGKTIVLTILRPIRPKELTFYKIDRGTTHLLFFKSPFVWDRLQDYDVSEHLVQLIKSQLPIPPPQPDTKQMEVRVSGVQVPSSETTYWCRVVRLPEMREQHHIIGYEPVISKGSEGLVHHLEVFLCVEDLPESVRDYDAPCNSETKPLGMTSCRKVIGAWAMGATGIFYPSEAGLPIGGRSGRSGTQYAVIELHYNNAAGKSGLVDSSGLRFYLTRRLRKFDVGIIELGLDYLPYSAVPPGEPRFELTGFCLPKCTNEGLPPDGIKIFASQLHTHTTGVRVKTIHHRPRHFVRVLNDDKHYSPHFQEIRLLPEPIRVLPGDALVTTCTFDTSKRRNVTLGGLSINNEMCLNYVFYYPKSQLELCKSIVSDNTLDRFFKKMNVLYGAETSRKKTIEENYQSIEWGRMEVAALKHMYRTGRIHQSCNSSSGVEISGHNWDNLKPIDYRNQEPETRDYRLHI
ncbi:hypothetical protein BOX15_Mlig033238g2 [Macrostomum lignano]|uniref:DOMON domain-containing protein n=1 Tax=Macrostomum lignano TaxID=282301 RepID=A0A267DIB8_9PLAT|nr:hypothetical protein BOX15_Mlig033238g2 [Macrostomum lignano]